METVLILAGVMLAHLIAVISPGPSLVVSMRTAVSAGRLAGTAVALGYALGSLVWASAAIFGLNLLFAAFPWIYTTMKVAGALYLIYVAIGLWRQAKQPLHIPAGRPVIRTGLLGALRRGLLVQLSNPKVVVFMGSILVTLLPPDPPSWMVLSLLAIVFFNEFAWYTAVALVFSTRRAQTTFARLKHVIDRVFSSVLGLLGLRFLLAD